MSLCGQAITLSGYFSSLTKPLEKMNFIILLFCITLFPSFSASESAYFLLNSECSASYTCTGDIHDVSVVCLNSKCICDPRLGVYDPYHYQCVGKADHVCLGERCTRNSFCEASSNTCKCHDGYNISSDGRCVQGHDGVCDEDEDCKRGLLCYDGKCECRYPNHQYYNAENDTCYSIAQSWDNTFKKASFINPGQGKSKFYLCFEMLFLLAHVGVLATIAVLLAKIGKLLNGIIVNFKLNGYFFRTSMEGRGQVRDSATIGTADTVSFFDGDSKV